MSKYTDEQQARIDSDKRDPNFLISYVNENAAILQPHSSGGLGVEMTCPCCANKIFAFYGSRQGKTFIKSHNGQCSDFNEYNDVFALMAAVKFGKVDGSTCIRAMDEHVGYRTPDPARYVRRQMVDNPFMPVSNILSLEQVQEIDRLNIERCRNIFRNPPDAAETVMLEKTFAQRGLDYERLSPEDRENVRFTSNLYLLSKKTGRVRKGPTVGVLFRTGEGDDVGFEVRCTDRFGIFVSKADEAAPPAPGNIPARRFDAVGPKRMSGIGALDRTDGPLLIFEGMFNEYTAKVYGCRSVSLGGAGVNMGAFSDEIKARKKDGNLIFICFDNDPTGREKARQLKECLKPLNAVDYYPAPLGYYNDVNDFCRRYPERCEQRLKVIPDMINDMFCENRLTMKNIDYLVDSMNDMKDSPYSEKTIVDAMNIVTERQNAMKRS